MFLASNIISQWNGAVLSSPSCRSASSLFVGFSPLKKGREWGIKLVSPPSGNIHLPPLPPAVSSSLPSNFPLPNQEETVFFPLSSRLPRVFLTNFVRREPIRVGSAPRGACSIIHRNQGEGRPVSCPSSTKTGLVQLSKTSSRMLLKKGNTLLFSSPFANPINGQRSRLEQLSFTLLFPFT